MWFTPFFEILMKPFHYNEYLPKEKEQYRIL